VPQEFLDRPDIIALLQQMHGNRVAEGMATHTFVESTRTPYYAHSLLHSTLMRMMAPSDPGARVFRPPVGGEDI
jgi:hypothetical protein